MAGGKGKLVSSSLLRLVAEESDPDERQEWAPASELTAAAWDGMARGGSTVQRRSKTTKKRKESKNKSQEERSRKQQRRRRKKIRKTRKPKKRCPRATVTACCK